MPNPLYPNIPTTGNFWNLLSKNNPGVAATIMGAAVPPTPSVAPTPTGATTTTVPPNTASSGPVAPAPSPAPAPAAAAPEQPPTGGSLAPPPGTIYANNPALWAGLPPEIQQQILAAMGLGGGQQQPPAPDAGQFDYPWTKDNRAAAATELLGRFGITPDQAPFFGRDYFGLPGQSDAGEQISQLIANLLYGQMGAQGERSQQAEDIIAQLAGQGQASSPWALMNDALMRSQEMVQPGALDAYRDQLVTGARTEAGRSEMEMRNRLRDLGAFSSGGSARDVAAQASNLANTQLSRALLSIEQMMADEEKNRLGLAGQLGAQGANVYGQMVAGPQMEYANLLRQAANPALAQFLDYLNQQAQTAVQGDVSFRAQPNEFERIGVPIISGTLSALGSAGGGLLSNPNLFK